MEFCSMEIMNCMAFELSIITLQLESRWWQKNYSKVKKKITIADHLLKIQLLNSLVKREHLNFLLVL